MRKNIIRILENFYSVPYYNTIITDKEVDYWLDNFDTLIICQGIGRRVIFSKITDCRYKAESIKL